MAEKNSEIAVFGAGCFWCTEAIFQGLRGVVSVTPGYAGGEMENPTYKAVSRGNTGHAEVIKIEFDPKIISYENLLEVFFSIHDPTTKDQQGSDVGEQYRSIILSSSESQKKIAEKYIQSLNSSAEQKKPIITRIQPLEIFYPAEKYHQDYYNKNPEQGYCQFVISPKIQKFRGKFSWLLKA